MCEPGAGDLLLWRQHPQVKGVALSSNKLRNYRFCGLPIYPLTKLLLTGIIGIEAPETVGTKEGNVWNITALQSEERSIPCVWQRA